VVEAVAGVVDDPVGDGLALAGELVVDRLSGLVAAASYGRRRSWSS
jgi:hypothetical protein